MFDYFTMMKSIAASAALGALVLAGSLQPATRRQRAEPPRLRRNKRRANTKCMTPRRRMSPRTTSRRPSPIWMPGSRRSRSPIIKSERVLYIQAYSGAKQYDKALDEAGR